MGCRLPWRVGLAVAGFAACCAVASPPPALAEANINVAGQTGILNTPTAEVIDEGDVAYQTSHYVSRAIQNQGDVIARSYSLTIGYLPDFEATARFTDYP